MYAERFLVSNIFTGCEYLLKDTHGDNLFQEITFPNKYNSLFDCCIDGSMSVDLSVISLF